jgi:hypothetical protein
VSGQAIDVPDMTAASFPVPAPVDETLTPGAVTSGFMDDPERPGRRTRSSRTTLKPGFGTVAFVSVTLPPSAAIRFCASVDVTGPTTPKNGIVTRGTASPVSGLDLIGPSTEAEPVRC